MQYIILVLTIFGFFIMSYNIWWYVETKIQETKMWLAHLNKMLLETPIRLTKPDLRIEELLVKTKINEETIEKILSKQMWLDDIIGKLQKEEKWQKKM